MSIKDEVIIELVSRMGHAYLNKLRKERGDSNNPLFARELRHEETEVIKMLNILDTVRQAVGRFNFMDVTTKVGGTD